LNRWLWGDGARVRPDEDQSCDDIGHEAPNIDHEQRAIVVLERLPPQPDCWQ
jgi:hypothetical protein